MSDNIQQWNKAAEAYAGEQEHSAFAESNRKVVRERFPGLNGERILDLGCDSEMGDILIRKMTYDDIPFICKADNDESDTFVTYLKNQLENQENGKCSALLALCDNQTAGYVFLYYACKWGGLKNKGIPGVVDLIVFKPYRRKGVATALMDCAEEEARKIHSQIYLDVCLNSEYGPAQRFYIKRGYVPDGAGVYFEGEVLGLNASCRNDDELSLCLVKELR